MVEIRIAKQEDAKEILSIYAPYITNTSLTFETEVPTLHQFEQRMESYLQMRPWLVCIIDKQMAAYAYASSHRERTAYQWCAECSIYIHERFQGKGIGYQLYTLLFEILKQQGYRNVYAVINLPNKPSVKLHEKCGFKWFATYEKVGYKLNKWKNVGWWRLSINDYNDDPAPPINFLQMNRQWFSELFYKAAEIIQSNV
jgi:phosphinothricin acetyltransferase